jgi:sugar/nucleoside kinase (ribokinase family)
LETPASDIAFIGQYTKDTIVSAAGTRVVDGGGFNYGAQVAARMGLRVVAVTRLAPDDHRVLDELAQLGVSVLVRTTPQSTCLRIEYPSSNEDERTIHVTSNAGAFTVEEVWDLRARAFVVGASMRGEVGLDVIEMLRSTSPRTTAGEPALLAADVQGFVRVAREGVLAYEPWPEAPSVLAHVDIVKADAVEAEMLTGQADIQIAARMLADLGPDEVVVTHRDGVLVHARGRTYSAGFFPAKLVGRSGRGDTCLAAYVARRLSASPAEATIWAAAVTSLKMEAEGPFRRPIPEVEALIRDRYSESHCSDGDS